MRNAIINGEAAFGRAYLRSVIDRVGVDEAEVRIIGRNAVLEGLVMGRGAASAGVRSSVRKLAHPTEFESVTSAFGEWIVAFAETIRFYPIARYGTEITKQI